MLSNAQRILDVVGAAAGLAVFAPVMAIIAVAIMADDGVPVLFRQERMRSISGGPAARG